MAEEEKDVAEPGAPIAKDAIDPDLVKLGRTKVKIGVLTAAGIMFLCAFFLWKLNPDRRFGGNDDKPVTVAVADVAKGSVSADQYVAIDGEPLMSHAVRSATAKGSLGLRIVPIRGSSQRLWIVLPGDGWEQAKNGAYVGRLRELADLPFADSVAQFLSAHPQPLFATATAVRAGFAANKLVTVSGDDLTVRDSDRVGFDVVDPNAAVIICTYNDRHANLATCSNTLTNAGIATTMGRDAGQHARFEVSLPGAVSSLTASLEKAAAWAVRVEQVTRHYDTTWGALKASSPAGFTVGATTIPDTQLDLVGVYVARSIPSGAYALITGERPADYWYVLPVSILVGLIGLLFAWAFVRAVKRDLLSPTTPTT